MLGIGAGSRLATLAATGLARNAVVRTGAYEVRVPYSRLNTALQRVNRLGARVTDGNVR
ncbi:MAG: phycobilisome linker polypeptide [Cyanobacteriota bacterium]